MEIPGVDSVQLDVIQDLKESKWTGIFETVIMNPPFGTKHNAGMDIKFLATAIALATGTVYSLHKSTTRYENSFHFALTVVFSTIILLFQTIHQEKITRMGSTS